METTSTVNSRNIRKAQVASSKSIEWMVDSYNAWQQRSPLPSATKKSSLSLWKLFFMKTQKVTQQAIVSRIRIDR